MVWCMRGWGLRVSPKNEVKQQQDWRLVFVDRLETFQIIDCLRELMSTRECFHGDLLSRSICVAACLPETQPRGASAECSDWASELGAGAGDQSRRQRQCGLRSTTIERSEAAARLRLVFVDRPETYRITDCLDELTGENVGYDRDLLSRSICATGRSARRCVCERSRPDQNWAGRAWHNVLPTRKCPLTVNLAFAQATNRSAAEHVIEGGNFDVLISAHCKTGCDRYAPVPPHQHCLLVASAKPRRGRTTQRPQDSSCVQLLIDTTRLLIAPHSSKHFACDDRWLVIVQGVPPK